MADYIPKNDADLNVWQGNLVEIIEPNVSNWGIDTEDFASVKLKQTIWQEIFAIASNKQNRTSADVSAKNDARAEYKKTIRGFVAQWLANNKKVTDADRTRMGLSVKPRLRIATPIPPTSPVGTIDFSVRLQHTIHFYDEASPRSKAKPYGVHGCEIYIKMDGDAPKDASEISYIATVTASPYLLKFDGNKVGKMVYYWLRWVNTRGQTGPWSITMSAMVVG